MNPLLPRFISPLRWLVTTLLLTHSPFLWSQNSSPENNSSSSGNITIQKNDFVNPLPAAVGQSNSLEKVAEENPNIPPATTSKGELDQNIEDQLKLTQRQLLDIEELLAEYEREKRGILHINVITRSSERSLDFQNQHYEMINKLSVATKLINKYEILSNRLAENSNILANLNPLTLTRAEYKSSLTRLSQNNTEVRTVIDKSINEIKTLQVDINNQLIEEVHRYQIKNHFRLWAGTVWVICFVGICGYLLWLIKVGTLKAKDPSSLQLFAMIMIIFVIALFGLSEVMGENGVTGLLAAIAGYILGKNGGAPADAKEIAQEIRQLGQDLNNPQTQQQSAPQKKPATQQQPTDEKSSQDSKDSIT